MRILVVHSFYRAAMPSGENDVVNSQVALLRSNGYDVELWGPTSPESSSVLEKMEIGYRVATGNGADPTEVLHSFQPDFVHVHNLFPNISMKWMRDCDIPIAMTLHNYRTLCANGVLSRDSASCTECLSGTRISAVIHGCYHDSRLATVPVLKFQDQLKRVIQQNVDLLVFPSEISRDVLSSRISHRRSIVLPNYVADIGVESTTDTDGVSPYFLVLGRLTPEKGVDQLLNHWPPSTPLVIAGDGPQRGELEKLASGKNVDFVGFVGPEIRDPLLRGAAGLVLPSITLEADPLVVAQALSAGTACVAREGTSSAQLSLLSPSVLTYSSADSLAQVLDQLLGNRRREEARTLYESRWSDRVWLKSYKSNVVEALCAP